MRKYLKLVNDIMRIAAHVAKTRKIGEKLVQKPIIAGVVMLLIISSMRLRSQEREHPTGVLPPHSIVAGKTLGDWSSVWWKWAFAIPANDNPLLDPTGEKSKFGDVGPVFFLAGVFNPSGSATVARTVTIPSNKFVFFPLVNFVNDNVGNGCSTPSSVPCATRLNIDTLQGQLNGGLPGITALHASIDGHSIGDLFSHRETSPVFSYTLQLTDNLQEVSNKITTPDATGTVFPVVADGYYLMLRPLPIGPHVINFGGVSFGNSLDVTYQVTVTPQSSSQRVVAVP
jgi:hypothetical protein